MALRKFGEDTPRHADDPIGKSSQETPQAHQDRLKMIKDHLLSGNTSGIDDLDVPEDIKDKIRLMAQAIMPVTEAALNEAVSELLFKARRSAREERATGGPGPMWSDFLDAVRFYCKLDEKDELTTMLVARLIYLLMTAIEELGREVRLDPQDRKYKFED